ncbi:MAG: hypothetical protein E6I03_12310 [Chloroflexi bacterium]|nr:MAG: hypothetical protein E6I03_12310 [Chloroflexota bacterium]
MIRTVPVLAGVNEYQTVLLTGLLQDGCGSLPSTVAASTETLSLKGSGSLTTVASAKLSFAGGVGVCP